MVCTIGNGYLLKFYIECEKNNVFPVAKPMEDHGKLEKEFLGERIAMMKAYYWQKKCPIYVDNGYSLEGKQSPEDDYAEPMTAAMRRRMRYDTGTFCLPREYLPECDGRDDNATHGSRSRCVAFV